MTTPHTCAVGACGPTRRAALVGGGAAGVALLAACAAPEEEPGDGTGDGGEAAGGVLAAVADVPVGGAVAATTPDGEGILLTSPSEGEIRAFSDVCTHAGCTVEAGEGELSCPCHGSVFDLATGEVLQGPARDPLPEIAVAVDGEDVVLA